MKQKEIDMLIERGKRFSPERLQDYRTRLLRTYIRQHFTAKQLHAIRCGERATVFASLRRRVEQTLPDDVLPQTAKDILILERSSVPLEQKDTKLRDRWFDPGASGGAPPGTLDNRERSGKGRFARKGPRR